MKLLAESILIPTRHTFGSNISKCVCWSKNCSTISSLIFLFDKVNLSFQIQCVFLCCPIWQCGLFQIPLDVSFVISVCSHAGLGLLWLVFSCRESRSWHFYYHKFAASSLKHKVSSIRHLQILSDNFVFIMYLTTIF